jgi:hypothetical protein
MSTGIVGTGLVTPFGDTPTEHAFFLRASVPAPPPSPFRLRSDESPLHVHYCRWIGAAAPMGQRMLRMADLALRDALRPCAALASKGDVLVMLCTSGERPGVNEEVLEQLSTALGGHGTIRRFSGPAAAFDALRRASMALAKREAHIVVVAAVDSFIAVDALDELLLCSPSEWNLESPAPSEGAAAVALMESDEARRGGVAVLGDVQAAAVARGTSNDDNDEPVDGAAMTVVLRSLPGRAPAGSAFGPFKVDLLRQDEWHLAAARNADRFAPDCRFTCLESHVGLLGAASGVANLAYGLAVHRHCAGATPDATTAPFFAWAISPDGARGAALVAPRDA